MQTCVCSHPQKRPCVSDHALLQQHAPTKACAATAQITASDADYAPPPPRASSSLNVLAPCRCLGCVKILLRLAIPHVAGHAHRCHAECVSQQQNLQEAGDLFTWVECVHGVHDVPCIAVHLPAAAAVSGRRCQGRRMRHLQREHRRPELHASPS